MKPTFVPIRVSHVFPFGLDATYAWLTDYRDDDPARTTGVVLQRKVVLREPGRVVIEGEIETFGRGRIGKAEVALDPPAHYVATLVEGPGRGSVFDYRLTPVAGGTRLDVVYGVRVKRWRSRLKVWLARPATRAKLERMWDGFDATMRRELSDGQGAGTPVDARGITKGASADASQEH